MICPEQESCKDYFCEHKRRTHYDRLNVLCLHFKDGACELLKGQACNIEKMRRIRKEVIDEVKKK